MHTDVSWLRNTGGDVAYDEVVDIERLEGSSLTPLGFQAASPWMRRVYGSAVIIVRITRRLFAGLLQGCTRTRCHALWGRAKCLKRRSGQVRRSAQGNVLKVVGGLPPVLSLRVAVISAELDDLRMSVDRLSPPSRAANTRSPVEGF